MPETTSLSKIIIAVVLACIPVVQVQAQWTNHSEHTQLTLLVRQLDMLERTAAESKVLSQSNGGRYHFDYQRLHADIERVRSGVHDYLTPQRAQPRDPVEVIGHYLLEKDLP